MLLENSVRPLCTMAEKVDPHAQKVRLSGFLGPGFPIAVVNEKRCCSVVNPTSSMAESNHTGWSDHEFFTGQVTVRRHVPGL